MKKTILQYVLEEPAGWREKGHDEKRTNAIVVLPAAIDCL